VYTGRYLSGGAANSFSLEVSPDRMKVAQIIISNLACGSHQHTFTLNTDVAIANNRFSATVPVFITPDPGHAHTLNIDGVFFDADGNGTREQVLGGLSFLSSQNRCTFSWWATAIAPDDDGDGWSDTAEQRLGSEPRRQTAFGFGENSKPEHREVPTTSLLGADVCQDFLDNDNFSDRDGKFDSQEADGPHSDPCPDCSGSVAAPSGLIARGISETQINLEWLDNSDNETGFEIERKKGTEAFSQIAVVNANMTAYADIGLTPSTPYSYRIRAVNADSGACTYSNYSNETIALITSVKMIQAQTPARFELAQNYPNPFNPTTTIAFSLPRTSHAALKIFDLLGKEIATLVDQNLTAGRYEAHWDAN
ncbi:MAG: fibronectin type III domain-containing protein, partial [bacterium]